MPTVFSQLNQGWNAEPNAPEPRIEVTGSLVRLTFTLNHMIFPFEEGATATIEFTGCWQYRMGPTNDEGWYRGQCRFSRLAPKWGEFYEVRGDALTTRVSDWKFLAPPPSASRHFLFYLRDETFECDASDWSIDLPPRPRN